MNLKISASETLEIQLMQKDSVSSIVQNVLLILNSWMGTVPMYRDFGISSESLHKPAKVAQTLLIASIQEAVERYEPRVSVREITFEGDADSPGKLIPTVEVSIKNE